MNFFKELNENIDFLYTFKILFFNYGLFLSLDYGLFLTYRIGYISCTSCPHESIIAICDEYIEYQTVSL